MSKPKKRQIFQFTPEQEKLFNLVTVPGTNTNSNVTVGENARRTGVQTLNFLAQEAARKDAEIEARSDRKTIKRLTTVGERLRGDNGYSSYISGGTGMSGRDPLLGTIFDWTVGAKGIDAFGKTALWNFAKYSPNNQLRGLARNYFINNAFKLELRKPILFGVGETLQPQVRTRLGDVEIDNPGLNYRVGTKEIIKDFQNSGVVRAGKVNSQKPDRAGRFLLTKQTFLAPMFKLGSLWYQPSEEMNGLLVTSEPLVVANKYASPVANKGIFTIEGKTFANNFGGRRIPAEGLILNKSNTIAYTWNPGYGYKLIVEEPSTSLKFFERPTYLSPLELTGATRLERNFTPKWHVAKYPGYLLKGLIGGSPLERLLSKNGTISVNQLNAYFNKASQMEREIANKVLTEKFSGLKTIDYNLFKKAVLDELIGSYNRVPLTEYADYGMDRLGINFVDPYGSIESKISILNSRFPGRFVRVPDKFYANKYLDTQSGEYLTSAFNIKPFLKDINPSLSTFTFESPRIPYGNTKHYGGKPIGHSRTYTLPEESNTLYVMESQSDWALLALRHKGSIDAQSAYEKALLMAELIKANLEKGLSPDGHKIQYEWERKDIEEWLASKNARVARFDAILHPEKYVLENHLKQNYLQRQIQENLRYAAERGLTKMRYPTSETAAKIEGYSKEPWAIDELGNKINPHDFWNFERAAQNPDAPIETLFDFPKGRGGFNYSPEYQTILKKYTDFPKLFLKLYKKLNVRTVTDTKGNTWYEVDVPKGYLSREWLFKQGGKMNTLQFLKNGSGIHIKKKNRGKYFKSINKYVNV